MDRTRTRGVTTVTADRPRLTPATTSFTNRPEPRSAVESEQRQMDEFLRRARLASEQAAARRASAELVGALERYSRVSAYTAGPAATTATITVGGRTVEVLLSATAVEMLTLAAHSVADDLTGVLGGLERQYAATRPAPVAPAPVSPRFTVLPGGVA